MSASNQSPNEPGAGYLVGGRYRLVDRLDEGGMSTVWSARRDDLDLDVAIKFAALASEEARRRFRLEAKAAGQLTSPHTTRVYDFGVDGGRSFIAMELLRGHTLAREIERFAPMDPERVAAIVSPVARALGEAHRLGILHRDIKPKNIFLADGGGEEVVKLLDFGIAKRTVVSGDSDYIATASHTLLGSPRYMSPEQACNEPMDHRSDLFSLAAVAYECLTGARLFPSEHVGELLVAIANTKYRPLLEVRPELPDSLGEFFERALAGNPELRFSDAGSFIVALGATARGEPLPEEEIDDEETAVGQLKGSSSFSGEDDSSPDDDDGARTLLIDQHAVTRAELTREVLLREPRRRRWPWALALLIALVALGTGLRVVLDDGTTPRPAASVPEDARLPPPPPVAPSPIAAAPAPSASVSSSPPTESARPVSAAPRPLPPRRVAPSRPRPVKRPPAPPPPPAEAATSGPDGIFDPIVVP
ncbi:MAG: serine/threonine-protein kinase [Myxococcota bacterium]